MLFDRLHINRGAGAEQEGVQAPLFVFNCPIERRRRPCTTFWVSCVDPGTRSEEGADNRNAVSGPVAHLDCTMERRVTRTSYRIRVGVRLE